MTTVMDSSAPTSPQAPPGYTFHPAANLFPLMAGAEFDDLVADIKANGQRETIKRLDGKILDGRNRLRTCVAAGIEPAIEDIKLATSPTEYVVSLNLRRRHLTPAQRAALAVEIAEHLAVEAKQRQQAAGVQGAHSGSGKKGSEAPLGDGSSPATTSKKKEDAKSTTKAAKAAGAGITAMKKLASIKKKAPEVFAQAKAGKVSVAQAERVVNRAGGKTVEKPVKSAPAATTTKVVAEAGPKPAASDTGQKPSPDQQDKAVAKTLRLPRDGSVVDGYRVASVTDDEVVVEIEQPLASPGVEVNEVPVVLPAISATEGKGDHAAADPPQRPEAARKIESEQMEGSAPAAESGPDSPGSFQSVATLVNVDETAAQAVAEIQASLPMEDGKIQTQPSGTATPTSGAGARGSNLSDQEVTALRKQVLAHLAKKGLLKRTLVDEGVFDTAAGLSRFLNRKKGLSRSRAVAIEAFLSRAGART